jgi:signal transduction histidine kinase
MMLISGGCGLLLGALWFAVSAAIAHELPSTFVAVGGLIAADVAVVLVVARTVGIVSAIPVGVGSSVAIDWHLIPPTHETVLPEPSSVAALAIYLTASVSLGLLSATLRHRGEVAEQGRRLLAEEQAALRRVATLVAREIPPLSLFAAVTDEARGVLEVEVAALLRGEADGSASVLAWSAPQGMAPPSALLLEDLTERSDALVRFGVPAIVVSPVTVAGERWGLLLVGSAGRLALPERAEEKLSEFSDLVAMSIANAQARIELQASRARIVARADEARRLLERDLHDGVQQHLMALALEMRAAESAPDLTASREALRQLRTELGEVADELRELSHGLHPAIVTSGGLRPALSTLVRRAGLPTELRYQGSDSPPAPVLVAVYYLVAETLTNIVKHARAENAVVEVTTGPTDVRVEIRDDGVGGADLTAGTGILGLVDRVEALGGHLRLTSRSGSGTTISVRIPYELEHTDLVEAGLTAARVSAATPAVRL